MEACEKVKEISKKDRAMIDKKLDTYGSDYDDEMSSADWFALGYQHAIEDIKQWARLGVVGNMYENPELKEKCT